MFRLAADVGVYLHRKPIDFLAGMNSLVTLVEQAMQLDSFSGAVFAFHNRSSDRIKLLLNERSGFWLMMKRLGVDRCPIASFLAMLSSVRRNKRLP